MKAIKLAVVLSMFAASSALGAIELSVTPAEQMVGADGKAMLTFSIAHNGDDTAIGGLSIYTATDKPGAAVIPTWGAGETPSRNLLAPWLNSGDFGVANLSVIIGDKPVEGINDLGAVTALVSVLNDGGTDSDLFTLALDVDAAQAPVNLTFSGGFTTAGFEDLAFDPVTVTLNAVPEPASMLLLAAGAAFFARRRRIA